MLNNVYWMYKRGDKKTKTMFWVVIFAVVLLLTGLAFMYSLVIKAVFPKTQSK